MKSMVKRGSKSNKLGVTVVAKLRNTILHDLAKKLGGQSALARQLGVSPYLVSDWCNLRRCPPKTPSPTWPAARLQALDAKLLELTGKLTDEIFPDMLRENIAFLNAPKTSEKAVELGADALTTMAMNFANRTQQSHLEVDKAELVENRSAVVVSYLNCIENAVDKAIVIKYLGLDGQPPRVFDELAIEYGFTRSRAQQRYERGLAAIQTVVYEQKLTEAVADLLSQPPKKLSPLSSKKEVVIDVKAHQHAQFEEAIT